jgi:hypothetical protein
MSTSNMTQRDLAAAPEAALPPDPSRTDAPAASPTRTGGSHTPAVTAASLAVGAALGFGGNFLGPGTPQTVAHGISSIGLVVGSALLALSFLRRGRDAVAAGFLVLAVAELALGNNGREGDIALTGFAASVLFYAPALLLISLPPAFPLWTRVAGALSGVAWAVYGGLFLLGSPPPPDGPVAGAGYALLTVALIGWIMATLRPSAVTAA